MLSPPSSATPAVALACAFLMTGCANPYSPGAAPEPAPTTPTAERVVPAAPALQPATFSGAYGGGGASERETLARIAHELAALEPLIRQGERVADRDARVRFEYGWLRQDLERMRTGIEEHLQAPRREPRRIEPLRAAYRS